VFAPNDVWLAGADQSARPFAAHWNGSNWTQTPLPLPTSDGSDAQRYRDPYIAALDGRSSTDLWAVGHKEQWKPAVLLHWDGHSWTISDYPYQARENGNNVFWSVTVTRSGHAWVAGHQAGDGVVLHWDGTTWKYVPTNVQHWYYNIASSSDKDVWGVGRGVQGPFAEHWNGTSWKKAPSATFGEASANGGDLRDVSVVSSRDAWAVGATDPSGGHAVVEHWNGTRWNASLLNTRPDAMLTAVKALFPTEVWAAGYTDGTDRSLIVHYSC
jgi:hypothetical protein